MKPGKNAQFWTAGILKSRGWSDELMRELLPRPQYRSSPGGSRVRIWPKEIVRSIEQQPQFQSAAAARQAQQLAEKNEITDTLQAAARFLDAAWENAPRKDTPSDQLAAHYHAAILSQISTVSWAIRLKSGQAASYVETFLSAPGNQSEEQIHNTLMHFVTAAPWMGRNTDSHLMQRLFAEYAKVLYRTAQFALTQFLRAQPEASIAQFLADGVFPVQELLSHPLGYIYSVHFVPHAIRHSLELLMVLNPKDEYPLARAMRRHFVLHIGGTNTGKTFAGFQRLRSAKTGIYLAPLRLLALEAQELLLASGISCTLTTGEEEDWQPGDTHISATAEKLDLNRIYDIAVIDECQMIADSTRGYAWTRAILGIQCPEVHLCAAPEAQQLLVRLIRSCGDSYEIVMHQRKVPLLCMKRTVDMMQLQPGDALITFSKIGVLSAAEELRQHGKKPAIIYGALPYATRRKQVESFLNGEVEYVVSTDAIGMGLNLPIRRIIFMETEKYDGRERRPLKPEEIQQIAGRAGRYGMYDRGYVGAMQNLNDISSGLNAVVPPLQTAVLGFSELVLDVDFDLLEVLEEWNRMPTIAPYRKLDISRYLTLISKIRESGFRLTKEQELRAATIPFDETEDALRDLFFDYLRQFCQNELLTPPQLPEQQTHTLPDLELYSRQLDLYFSFAKTFGFQIDTEELYNERDWVSEQINQILLHNLRNNIRFCSQCGTALDKVQ